ncbi:MAG: MFS transporter [Ideonella sp. MAG2]|nr:MAG: MFS transporter [Ideonella sp. MAG2]
MSQGLGAPPPPVGPSAGWALMFGNFAIGCGVMVVGGSLNDLTRSLNVSVAIAGQLITVAAVMMCLGAPVLAAALSGWCRRRLLSLALGWYALGHALCALMPDYATLMPLRALTVLSAAVFTPQAGAAMGWLAPPEQRGRAITFVFLGWSVASVVGMPLHAYIGETWGWRYAFGLVAVLAALGAGWVWHALPEGVRPPRMDRQAWGEVFAHPRLMWVVAVTALAGAGQFTLFAYFSPYLRQGLNAQASEISVVFACFGTLGLMGNLWLSQRVDALGAARAVGWLLALQCLSMALWPLASSVAGLLLLIAPWALSGFACASAQQARLASAAPALAPALLAMNTSAIYLGQALGAAGGGLMMTANAAAGRNSFVGLSVLALAWTGLALWLSHTVRQAGLRAKV